MAPLPGRNILPASETCDEHGSPTLCYYCCVRRANGVGIGYQHKGDKDPKFLCTECMPLLDIIKSIRRFDTYELKAIDGAVDAVGDFIAERGNGTDLQYFDELDQRMLCKRVVVAFGDELRRLLRSEAPF